MNYAKKPNGAGYQRKDGYRQITVDNKKTLEHIALAEKALGRKLKYPEQVHHVNEIRNDNRPQNLVICPNRFYHSMIHYRMKALSACGNANFYRCRHCMKYDDLKNNMRCLQGKNIAYHRDCANAIQNKRRGSKCDM